MNLTDIRRGNVMRRLWRKGWHPARIGLVCGISPAAVKAVAARKKWRGPKHRPLPETEIALAVWAGWSAAKIAGRFGIKRAEAKAAVQKITARPSIEAKTDVATPHEIAFPPKRAKTRVCLFDGCGRSFVSTHAGERICPTCKQTNEWRRAA